jgi:Nucleotidyl transferase AbiEii toxin, Type IV TA system
VCCSITRSEVGDEFRGCAAAWELGHLTRLLGAWRDSQDEQITEGRLRKLVGVTLIASALDGLRDENGKPRLVIKGGSGLALRFGSSARASQDLDTAYRGSLDEAIQLVKSVLGQGHQGFIGTLGVEEPIVRAGVTPPPIRTKIKLLYTRGVTRPFVTIPFEISAGEGDSLDYPDEAAIGFSLTPVQLDTPEKVAFLPLPYQIAQKLHASTDNIGAELRVHDLMDILFIKEIALGDDDYPAIRTACEKIFAGRGRHAWPPMITTRDGWPEQWERLIEVEQTPITLNQAIADVNGFVDVIARS